MPTLCSLKKLAWIPLVAAASVSAQPTVTVDSVTLDSDDTGVTSDTYNGTPAVCNGNIGAGLGVTATFTPTFSTGGSEVGALQGCVAKSNCGGFSGDVLAACEAAGGNKYNTAPLTETEVQNESVASAASDTFSDSVDLAGTNVSQSGDMPLAKATTDGLIVTTVAATASEQRRTRSGTRYFFYSENGCSGTETFIDVGGTWSGWTTYDSSEATNSASYYLDVEAPTLCHTVTPDTVTQCESVSYNMTASGGSSGQPYTLQPKAIGPPNIDGPTTDGNFAMDTSDGIAPDEVQAAALGTCGADPGLYTSGATLSNSTDLCGDEWGDISSSCSPTFTVTAASTECTNQAVVTAPLTGTPESGGSVGYEVAECYNTESSNGKGKFVPISSSPGTVHVGAIVRAGEDCEDSEGFVEDIAITRPAAELPRRLLRQVAGGSRVRRPRRCARPGRPAVRERLLLQLR
jgi:hypothetical protein